MEFDYTLTLDGEAHSAGKGTDEAAIAAFYALVRSMDCQYKIIELTMGKTLRAVAHSDGRK